MHRSTLQPTFNRNAGQCRFFEALLESDALGYSLSVRGYLQSDCVPDY